MLIYFDVFVKDFLWFYFFVGIAGETRSDARMASEGPRATVLRTLPGPVGRGPVPRHAAVYRKIAGETRSDARMASEGPALR